MPHFDHLICPLCRQGFTLTEKSARCPQGHTFDLARQGYLNLHVSPVKTQYTKDLYLARRHLFQNGVFNPLVASLSTLLLQHRDTPSAFLLDAGCGDGSLLAAVIQTFSEQGHTSAGLGIDLCKDAVKIASRSHPALTWCVADLARPPIADSTQDIILNILAPANYAEFKRLLKPNGILAKVLPGPSHFQEIRRALASTPVQATSFDCHTQYTMAAQATFPDRHAQCTPADRAALPDCHTQRTPAAQAASPDCNPRNIIPPMPDSLTPRLRPAEVPQSMAHAHPHFIITETQRLTYDVPAAQTIEHFIHMSPLAWHTLPEKKESAQSGRLQKIRLDYIITLAYPT